MEINQYLSLVDALRSKAPQFAKGPLKLFDLIEQKLGFCSGVKTFGKAGARANVWHDFLAISYLISNLILCLAKISVSKFQK